MEAVLGRGGDPRLVLAVEGDGAGARRLASALSWPTRKPVAPPRPTPAAPTPAEASRRRRVSGLISMRRRRLTPGSRRWAPAPALAGGRTCARRRGAGGRARGRRAPSAPRRAGRRRLDHGRLRLQAEHPGQQRAGDRARLDQPGQVERLALEAVEPARLVGGVGAVASRPAATKTRTRPVTRKKRVRLIRTPPR